MSDFHIGTKAHIPARRDVPTSQRLALIAKLQAEKHRRSGDLQKTVRRVQPLIASQRDKTKELLGARGYDNFRKALAAERAAVADAHFPPVAPVPPAEMARLAAERNNKVASRLRRSRIDLAGLKELNKGFADDFAKKLKVPNPERDGKPVLIMKPEDVPEPIRMGRPNPWTIEKPPYDNWKWSYNGYTDGFTFVPTLHQNHAGGFTGNTNYLKDSSASDFDWAYIDYYASLGMWYKMPKASGIEVWVKAQPTWNQHYCSLYDEWGWSDSSVSQSSYITLQVDGGDLSQSRATNWWERHYDEGYWNNYYLTNWNDYWFHLYSMESYAADDWIMVWIGAHTYNYTYANDVSVYSEVDFRWFIKEVYIRPIP